MRRLDGRVFDHKYNVSSVRLSPLMLPVKVEVSSDGVSRRCVTTASGDEDERALEFVFCGGAAA
jgi:hypothetical protein